MAEPRYPVEYPEVKSGVDINILPTAGYGSDPQITQQTDVALQAIKDQTRALEQRYAQPNWFRVAAGLAKPQLGGFAASLGSAFEELGAQQEAQRAIAPTIARMRSEVAAKEAGYAVRTKQQQLFDQWLAQHKQTNEPMTDTQYSEILKYGGPETDAGRAAKGYWEAAQKGLELVGGTLSLQKEIQKNPSLVINHPVYKGMQVPEKERNEYVAAVNNTPPPGVNPSIWKGMTFTQKQDLIADAGNKQTTQGLEEGQRASLESKQSHDVLDKLTTLRTLATDKDLAPVFSVLNDGDLFGQYRAFLDKYPGNVQAATEGLVNATLNRLSNATPQTRAKFDKLVKDIAALEVRLRGTLNNPTDAASILNQAQSPSLANSQSGFVGILDQLGLNAYQAIEYNNIRHKKGLTMSDLMSTDDMIDFRNRTRELSQQLALQNALDTTPIWYYPGRRAQGAAAPQSGAPQGGGAQISVDAIRAELERRQRAKGIQ